MNGLELEGLSPRIQVESLDGSGAGVARALRRQARDLGDASGAPVGPDGGGATTFSQILRDSVDKVNQAQHEADLSIRELVAGRTKNIHETMLTIERADVSLKMMMQVRNKILEAYREIMRMQV